jgi:cysteine-rich repeat protein
LPGPRFAAILHLLAFTMNARGLISLLALSTPLALQTGCGPCEGGEFFYCHQPAAVDSESASTSAAESTGSTDPTESTTVTVTSETSGTETMATTDVPSCNMNGSCDEGESAQSCPEDCKNCGNGSLDDGEVCDDGANNSPDNAYHAGEAATAPCNSSCTGKVPYCGDGVCEPDEENTISCPDDGCVAACGNGAVEAGETCDDGNGENTDACLDTCQPATCGDGFVQDGVEATNTDACVSMCKAATCGDGLVWAGMEDCDDGNADETDTCDTACKEVIHRKVFISSTPTTGSMLGLPGADLKCQTFADVAGLPGTYKAWLSDANEGPADRFDTSFTGVYELLDGNIVAHGWADLTDGSLMHAINVTQNKSELGTGVWTNTTPSGTPLGANHCSNWGSANVALKGSYGLSPANDTTWTESKETALCSGSNSLYCFEDPA